MTAWLRAALLALLAVPGSANSAPYLPSINAMHVEAWRLACLFKSYDCSTLEPPQVWYMHMPGTLGRYMHNAANIEINVHLAGQTFSFIVVVHEMVHYIQNAQGAHRVGEATYRTRCQREAEAFNIGIATAVWIGYNDVRITSWPEMADQYGCGSAAFIKITR